MNTDQRAAPQLDQRVSELEATVQEIRFHHMVKVDAMSYGLGLLHRNQQQLQQELTGFRAEATAHLTALKTDMTAVQTDVAALKTDVAGIKKDVTTLKTNVTCIKTDVAELKAAQGRQGGQLDKIVEILQTRG